MDQDSDGGKRRILKLLLPREWMLLLGPVSILLLSSSLPVLSGCTCALGVGTVSVRGGGENFCKNKQTNNLENMGTAALVRRVTQDKKSFKTSFCNI